MATYAGRYSEDLQDRYGNAFRNAKVAVQTLVGGAVTLYADRTKTAYVPASGLAANEIKADEKGNLRFFADPGNYQIVVTPSGGSALTAFPISVLPDPLEPDASEGALQAEQEAREAADTALTQAITNEGTTRANADTALQGSIDTLTTGKQDKEPSRIYVSSTGNDANAGTMPGAPLATLTQAVTNAGSTQTTIVILNALSVAANVTLPTTVRLEFVGAGRLTPTSGMTVTISGTFVHPARQIFSTLSGGTIAFASTARVTEMYPEWWGAAGNGTTPDGTPLTASAVAAASIGVPLIVTKIHGLSNTLSLPSNADLRGRGGGFKRVNTSTASALIATTGTTGVKMRGFTADANALMTGTVVLIQDATDFEVKRLQVSDPARNVGNLIQVSGASQDGVVKRNTCDGGLVAIRVTGTSRHIKVVRNRTKNTKNRGVYVVAATATEAPSDIDIEWNTCTDLDSSGTVRSFIQVVGRADQRIERVRIVYNTVIGPGFAYGAIPAGTADQITVNFVDGLQIIGNKSILGGDVGISGSNNSDVVLALNEASHNNSTGLAQGGGSGATYNITILGNTLRNNGQNQNADREDWARVGIYLMDAHNVVIGGNVIVDDQATKTQMYAGSYKDCTDVTITPNAVIDLGVSNGWFDRGGNTGLKEVIPTAIP